MDKVFIVTSGEYSDYHVHDAFSTIEKAQEYIDVVFPGVHGMEIEEFVLDPTLAQAVRQGLHSFHVQIYVDSADIRYMGKYNRITEELFISFDLIGNGPDAGRKILDLHLHARDEEHAAKIAMEKRTAWLLERDRDERHD